MTPDREGAAVEALTERLRREFWRPENGGQWERIARAVIAAGWVPQSEVTERERAAAEKAWDEGVRQQWAAEPGKRVQFNPYRVDQIGGDRP